MYKFVHINIFYISRLFFIIYFHAPQFVYTGSEGEVRIVLDSLSNPYGVTSENKCCDGGTRDTLTSKCRTPCRMQVKFCITPGDFYQVQQCTMGKRTSETFQGNEISFELPDLNLKEPVYENYQQISNTTNLEKFEKADALVFRIKHALREEVFFQLLIEILHVPDEPQAKPEVISKYTTSIPFNPHGIWRKNRTDNQYGPNLEYSLKVKCDKDYGGSACAFFCVPRDKWDGHFDCDENKRLVCHAGYTGQFCNIPMCDPTCENGHCLSPYKCSCSRGWKGYTCGECVVGPGCLHGTCDEPYECNCSEGWSGGTCDTCVKAPGCVHGACNLPDECNCDIGWTGENCDQKVTCDMQPCENGALCLQHSDNYTCQCPKGLAGIHCEIDILDHCDPFPCTKSSAICLDKPFGYECSCPLGWGGVNCTERDMCSLDPCVNSHECNNIGNDYYCSCKHGWSGKNCTQNSNDCHGQCQNNATCVDKVSEYLCECQPGFSGKNCEINVNECAVSPCQNQGVCKDQINGYKCICQTGFSGKNCSVVFDRCSEIPCKNDGLCTRFHNDYKCKCAKGWTGRNCETSIHTVGRLQECKNDPCRHGSTCYMQAGKEKCHCTAGYTGRYCQIDIDDCVTHKCQNSAQCIDRVDSYECVCPPGFNGKHCQNNVNECENNPCQNGGNCTDGINGYTCQCPIAYRGHDCSYNINDCKNIVCENGGTCLDGINKYSCKCAEGFMGQFCEIQANQCLNRSCTHGKCLQQRGGYACVCDLGYIGEFCEEEINECLGITCHNKGKCVDKIGQYECNCSKEFYGPNCQHINACLKNPCQNKGVCFNEGDGYQCKCQSGFFGKNCEKAEDSCMVATYNSTTKGSSLVPRGVCGKHGKCVSLSVNEFKCKCEKGWTGDSCSTNINYCQGNLCRNGGTCLQINDGYICKCGTPFSGRYCELSIRKCDRRPCDNGGLCIDLPNDYNCSCINGWKGKTCNSRSNNCDSSPCLHGGNCTDFGNTFQCHCPEGFVGPTCAERKDLCKTTSCLNGGTCLSSNDSFACLCPTGFSGTYCGKDIDYCASNPCKNQAACQDGIGSYHCICQTGYVGSDCQYPVDQCNPNPCAGGSTCQNVAGSYRCACPEGRYGPKCDNVKLQTCVYQNETFYDNEIWKSDCNQCRCKNGKVTCNEVECGPVNCYRKEKQNSDCVCREKPDADCITPPCPKWGECVTYKTSSIHNGGCKPALKEPSLSKDCSSLNIKFEKVLLPPGILVEEICEELRYSDVLQDPLLKREIILECQRFTSDANQNELIVSVYAKDRAVDVSVVLAEFYKYETRRGSVLHKLNRTTTKVFVRRHTLVKFRPPDRLNLLVPILTGLVVISLMILFGVCVYYNIRRRSQQALNSEVFFTQKQNEFPTKGQFSTKDHKPCKSLDHSEKDEHEDKSNRYHYKKPFDKGVPSSSRLSTINEFVPDKLYMSDTNDKFSHC